MAEIVYGIKHLQRPEQVGVVAGADFDDIPCGRYDGSCQDLVAAKAKLPRQRSKTAACVHRVLKQG